MRAAVMRPCDAMVVAWPGIATVTHLKAATPTGSGMATVSTPTPREDGVYHPVPSLVADHKSSATVRRRRAAQVRGVLPSQQKARTGHDDVRRRLRLQGRLCAGLTRIRPVCLLRTGKSMLLVAVAWPLTHNAWAVTRNGTAGSADRRHGQGTYSYANGDAYDGGWQAGARHGKGMYYFGAHQCQFFGCWQDGSFAFGTWVFKDGTTFGAIRTRPVR
eukprot:COSAG01_NODE_3293_length_6301_cov_3.437278_9_plen_217_part_00